MPIASLRDLAVRAICSSLLFDVDEFGIISPKPSLLAPHSLHIDSDTAPLLLNCLRTSRCLTKELLQLFNEIPLTELSLSSDYPTVPSSRELFPRKPSRSPASLKQFRIDDTWLEILWKHHPELRSLELTQIDNITDDGLSKIISSLSSLIHLDLGRCQRLTDSSLSQLHKLPRLLYLTISATQATTKTIRDAISKLSNLTYLDVSSNSTLISLSEIANGLPNLRTLIAAATKVDDEGFRLVSQLTKLEKLDISLTHVSSEGIHSIKNLTSLTSLNLNLNSKIDGSICPTLAELSELTSLSLSAVDLSDPPTCLLHLTNLQKLESLSISKQFRPIDAFPLTTISSLKRLSMFYTSASDFLLSALCPPIHLSSDDSSPSSSSSSFSSTSPSVCSLLDLNIVFCPLVSDVGISHLSSMTSLTSLSIGSPHITNRSVESLLHLTNLQKLEIWETKISFDALVEIKKLPFLVPLDDRIPTSAGTFLFTPIK